MHKPKSEPLFRIHGLLGIILIAAATAKLFSGVQAGSGLHYLTPSFVFRLLAFLVEFLVGAILLSRIAPRAAHFAATLVFAILVPQLESAMTPQRVLAQLSYLLPSDPAKYGGELAAET